jgi:hypothetical protein
VPLPARSCSLARSIGVKSKPSSHTVARFPQLVNFLNARVASDALSVAPRMPDLLLKRLLGYACFSKFVKNPEQSGAGQNKKRTAWEI